MPDGESEVRVKRVTAEYVYRDANRNASVRIIGSRGTVSPTIDQDIPGAVNPHYRLAQLGATFVQRFGEGASLPIEVRFRLDGQFSAETLAPVERLSFGGSNSVRGYRENLFLRDRGAILRSELGVETIELGSWLKLSPSLFVDTGWGRDVQPRQDGTPRSISSAGVNLETRVGPYFRIGAAWAHGFKRAFANGGNLQDRGVHLTATVSYP